MNVEEFLVRDNLPQDNIEKPSEEEIAEVEESDVELDVQKAVVESLAAEKVEQEEKLTILEKAKNNLETKVSQLEKEILKLREELATAINQLVRNEEKPLSNQISLLDREITLSEKFPGEVRDHVIEVIKEARDNAEKENRLRRAQVLESVLVANQPSGELDKKREELDKLFSENQNAINGIVIEGLKKMGLSHKNGENFLLVSEIKMRNF